MKGKPVSELQLTVFSSISLWNISSLAGFDGEWFKSGSRVLYHLRACISESHLKDLLLCSTCRQGVLLKPSRWSQNMCWTALILDRDLQICRRGGTITNPTPILFTNTVFLTREPRVQVYTEQPGQEADARQTNDSCYRTKTIQNNFINSVTFLLCTSVQPYPSGLLRKIDNACFLFRFFPERQTQNQPSVHYLHKCNTISHPQINFFH